MPPPPPGSGAKGPGADTGLVLLGLHRGERVRWRAGTTGRWRLGRVTHRERDGSVGVTDHRGLARSLTVGRLEVHIAGPRGGQQWEPLATRAARSEQLRLL
jgi:hypothetical protein